MGILDYLVSADSEDEIEEIESRYGVKGRFETGNKLASIIASKYKRYGFVSAIVYGEQGAGKSIYCMKTCMEVARLLGLELEWRSLIDDYVLFEARELVRKLRGARRRLPFIVWDDAGVHGSGYWFFLDKIQTLLISALYQTARTKVTGFIVNTPSPVMLLRHLRSVDSIIIHIIELDEEWSRARAYRVRIAPSGRVFFKRYFIYKFRRRMPEYEYYLEKRQEYTNRILEALEKTIDTGLPENAPLSSKKKILIARALLEGKSYSEIQKIVFEKLGEKISYSTIAKTKKELGLSV